MVLVDLIVWNIIIVSSVLEIVLVVGFFLGKYAQPSFFFFFPTVGGVVKKVKRETKIIMELGWENRGGERGENSAYFGNMHPSPHKEIDPTQKREK